MLVKAEKWLTEAEASLSANPDLKRLTVRRRFLLSCRCAMTREELTYRSVSCDCECLELMGDVVGLSDQALLEESGSLPVDVTEMCEQLQIKVDQANKWVDKVSSPFRQIIVELSRSRSIKYMPVIRYLQNGLNSVLWCVGWCRCARRCPRRRPAATPERSSRYEHLPSWSWKRLPVYSRGEIKHHCSSKPD